MNTSLYNKSVTCPVCNTKVEVTRVKSKECIVSSRDTDFCVYYENVNPIFYDAWVCKFCGYAAQSDRFESLSKKDADAVKKNISPHWNPRKFNGERNVERALKAFKLALISLQVTGGAASEFAKVCIRIAWLYRINNDKKELDFLKHALKYYIETYEKERLPAGKLDEYTCMYMIAELSRRTGNIEDSLVWFNKLISSPDARENKALIENAREQYQQAREEKKKLKISLT